MALRVGVDGRVLVDAFPGIGRHVWGLLKALPVVAPDAEFVAWFDPRARNTRFDLDELRDGGLHLHPLPVGARSLAEQWALPRALRGLRLDVVHAPYPFTAWACPAPRVLGVYDTIALDARFGLQPWPRRALAGLMLRAQARRAAAIVTLSHAAARAVARDLGVPTARVHVAPPGLERAFGHVSPDDRATTRRALALPDAYVLAVGTHKPHKNLAGLLAAWSQARTSAGTRHTLVLAGVGADGAARLRARFALDALGVHVLAQVPEPALPALYAGATLLVVPSLDEGFGLTLLEGLAAGTPVLAARRGALPEVAGDAAELFDPADPAALATALSALLADTARRAWLAQAGRTRAAGFSRDACARATFDIYRAVAQPVARHGLRGIGAPAPLPRI